MNRKTVSILVIAAAASTAYAQDPAAARDDFVSTMKPEAVQAELMAFKKSGVNPWSGLYDPLKSFVSKYTRAEVTTGYIAVRGLVTALTGEDSGSTWLAGAREPAQGDTTASIR